MDCFSNYYIITTTAAVVCRSRWTIPRIPGSRSAWPARWHSTAPHTCSWGCTGQVSTLFA